MYGNFTKSDIAIPGISQVGTDRGEECPRGWSLEFTPPNSPFYTPYVVTPPPPPLWKLGPCPRVSDFAIFLLSNPSKGLQLQEKVITSEQFTKF